MAILNFFIGVLCFLGGIFIGSLIGFDWEAFWRYRQCIIEMKEGDNNDRT